MWCRALPIFWSFLLGALPIGPGAMGEETAAAPSEPKTLRELIDSSLAWYDVFPSAEATEPAEAIAVLRWANNQRGSQDGVTVLFVHGGRPLAAACIYPWAMRLEHDFESLSRDNILAKRDDAVIWQPQEAGVKFADVPSAPIPDDSRPQRLRQMKTLAEKFQATLLGWKRDNSDREELRLLTRPLYRYDPKAGPVIDGAVFAFAMGTDPEVLLLIEAVKEGDKARWQYAFARRTSGELEGRLGDQVVWQAARFPTQIDPRLPHFTRGTPLPAGLEEASGTKRVIDAPGDVPAVEKESP
jgi:hypothetical protein